jgi:hypothetical protein
LDDYLDDQSIYEDEKDWFIKSTDEEGEEEEEYYVQENMDGIRELFSPNTNTYSDVKSVPKEKVPLSDGFRPDKPSNYPQHVDPYRQTSYTTPNNQWKEQGIKGSGDLDKGYLYNMNDYANSYSGYYSSDNKYKRDPTVSYLVADNEDSKYTLNNVHGAGHNGNNKPLGKKIKGEAGSINSNKEYSTEHNGYNMNSNKAYGTVGPYLHSESNNNYPTRVTDYQSNKGLVVERPQNAFGNGYGYSKGEDGYYSTGYNGYKGDSSGYQSTSYQQSTGAGPGQPLHGQQTTTPPAVPGPNVYNADNYWSLTKGQTAPYGDPDFNDYEIDFYGEKNYEYIDTDESEDLKKIFEVNRKLSESYSNDLEKIELEFEPVDYQNYDFAEVGVLDFR